VAQAEGPRANLAQADAGARPQLAQAEAHGQQVARIADPCR
jgi:hypothetical protein